MVGVYLTIGIVLGLFGWTLYWAGVPIMGAVVGGSVGGSLGYLSSAFASAPGTAAVPVFVGIGALIGAVAGFLLVRALQLYFFFMAGMTLGAGLGYRMAANGLFGISAGTTGGWVFVLIMAVLGGFALVWARRFVVAVVTSVVGAFFTSMAFPPAHQDLWMFIVMLFYLAVQVGLVRRFVREEPLTRKQRQRLRRMEYPDVDTAD